MNEFYSKHPELFHPVSYPFVRGIQFGLAILPIDGKNYTRLFTYDKNIQIVEFNKDEHLYIGQSSLIDGIKWDKNPYPKEILNAREKYNGCLVFLNDSKKDEELERKLNNHGIDRFKIDDRFMTSNFGILNIENESGASKIEINYLTENINKKIIYDPTKHYIVYDKPVRDLVIDYINNNSNNGGKPTKLKKNKKSKKRLRNDLKIIEEKDQLVNR
jgi:hypothetical protein